MSFRVLLTDSVHPVCTELLEEAGMEVVDGTSWEMPEILSRCANVEGWIIRSGTTIDAEMIAAAQKLVVIGRAGVGVDNVDIPTATKKGVLVLNAPAGNTISTAEHTMAMLLALARKLAPASSSLKSGNWERKKYTGTELFGKTVGIVGIGKIGREVALRCRPFGLKILGSDPVLTHEAAERLGIELVDIDQLFSESDYITVHTPLIPATEGLLNDETLAMCKRGVCIINCARGGIVDEQALLRALESGQVSGAALDVYSSEPPNSELTALIAHPGTVTTPHIAASTGEAQEKVARQVTEQVIHALRNEPVETAINAMALRMAAQPEVQPYVALAQMLGRASRQLFDGAVDRFVVRCHGDVPRRYTDVMRIAALKGFLEGSWNEVVNLVNAPIIAENAGIEVDIHTFHPGSSFSNLIEIEMSGSDGSFSIAGTLFGSKDARITAIDGYEMELKASGRILLYRNQDRPGMLASVGLALADAGINIGSLVLGRNIPGEEALTAVTVDQPIPQPILARVAQIEGVHGVCMLELMP
jgi:D-3-phosphoglycerate dehydrogenase